MKLICMAMCLCSLASTASTSAQAPRIEALEEGKLLDRERTPAVLEILQDPKERESSGRSFGRGTGAVR
jgi:hypothetical protein